METFDLQDLITEKNTELQEFIKEQMRVHQLSNLSIDQRELMIDTPAISTKQMIDAYYSTIQHVAARLIELEGNNEAWNKHRAIIMKKVAKKEKEQNARPAIKNKVEDWNSYDTIFIGCPVWWWTAPMIINTFTESYNFKGKTVIPFCTYASTYRDETLAKIAELTPDAKHLKGFGAISRNTDGITEWLKEIRVIK